MLRFESAMKQKSIGILTTISFSIKMFYPGQIQALNRVGLRTTVLCADDSELPPLLPVQTRFIPIGFSRLWSPLQDLKTLWQLYKVFRRERFDLVQYSTPKASLLGALAAWAARIPVRIYILWGLYYTGQSGFVRTLLKSFEKIICTLSTHIVPISHEMVDFVHSEGLAPTEKCSVMCHGSACGVDLQTFDPLKWQDQGKEIRKNFSLPPDAVVVGAVARLTNSKGINELVAAFTTIAKKIENAYLLIVGQQEEKDRLLTDTEYQIQNHPRIKAAGHQENPLPFYAAMDIFCLPTYREGFGEVNLEAQAMRLPVISTDTIGPRESVNPGVTGFLVPTQSTDALIEPLKSLILNDQLRRDMGQKGRQRVESHFDRKDIINAVIEHRLRLLRDS
jgi:glycosyltransferase involved in cell wall biosynthesis